MEDVTPARIIEKDLPSRFKPDKARGIDTVVQIVIKGPHGGSWTVMIRDQKMEAKEGIHPSPKLAIEMEEADFMDLINGKLNGTMAFFSGKLKLKGDVTTVLKLKDAGFL
jgi:putative sterol carrier protein